MIVCLDSAAIITAFRNQQRHLLAAWIAQQEAAMTCDLVRAEIRSGILGTSNQQTRDAQECWYAVALAELPSRQLDRPLCEQAAILVGSARRKGYHARIDDALVAAAALEAGATVATTNVKHFEQLGVAAVNPLTAG